MNPYMKGLKTADKHPKFQFDIEKSRFNEFTKEAKEVLQANARDYDIPPIHECLFQDLCPSAYLDNKKERPLPDNLEDELARYALSFPNTMNLSGDYTHQSSNGNLLIYQEQMLDILRQVFRVSSLKANQIRLSIQRRESAQVEAYRKELFANLQDITRSDAEIAWQRLTSNPHAFLKAHAVSRIVASYKYETGYNKEM